MLRLVSSCLQVRPGAISQAVQAALWSLEARHKLTANRGFLCVLPPGHALAGLRTDRRRSSPRARGRTVCLTWLCGTWLGVVGGEASVKEKPVAQVWAILLALSALRRMSSRAEPRSPVCSQMELSQGVAHWGLAWGASGCRSVCWEGVT